MQENKYRNHASAHASTQEHIYSTETIAFVLESHTPPSE